MHYFTSWESPRCCLENLTAKQKPAKPWNLLLSTAGVLTPAQEASRDQEWLTPVLTLRPPQLKSSEVEAVDLPPKRRTTSLRVKQTGVTPETEFQVNTCKFRVDCSRQIALYQQRLSHGEKSREGFGRT